MMRRNMRISSIILCTIGLFGVTYGGEVYITPSSHVYKFLGESGFVASCRSTEKVYWENNSGGESVVYWDKGRERQVYVGGSTELHIDNIARKDDGVYTCYCFNRADTLRITVLKPISFDSGLSVQYALEGQSYMIKCAASGHTTPKISWKIDSQLPLGDNYKILQNGSLLIRNVTHKDSFRTFTCIAQMFSPRADAKQMDVKLHVNIIPRARGVIGEIEAQWGLSMEWATLTCEAIASPEASFAWYHKGKLISDSESNEIIDSDKSDNLSVLKVFVRNESQLGEYYCVASNAWGSFNRTFKLIEARRPLKPILKIKVLGKDEISVSVINEPSPTEEMSDADDWKITEYLVEYREFNETDWIKVDIVPTNNGFVLRDLVPSQTYILRVASRNKVFDGDFSQDLKFTTLEKAEFNAPNNRGLKPYPIRNLFHFCFSVILVHCIFI